MLFDSGIEENTLENNFSDPNIVIEALIVDQITHLGSEAVKEFCAPGGVGEQLVQEGKFRNKTLVKLSKDDDLNRRKKIINLKLASERNDPLYKAWVKIHQKEKELLSKINKKYDNRSTNLAKQSQREYLHPASSKKVLPKKFLDNGVGRVDEDD